MKQLRFFLLLAVALLTGSTVQAQQYLNIYGTPVGSVPLAKLDSVSVSSDANSGFVLTLHTDQGLRSITPTSVDSLTITDQPAFALPVSLQSAYLRYTPAQGGESQVVRMTPVWGQPDVYHAMIYITSESKVEYSFDQEVWTVLKSYFGYDEPVYEGWTQFVLDARSDNYLYTTGTPLIYNDNRSSRAKQGFAYVIGSVTGDWTDRNPSWRLSMPVNAEGWWASPRFVADGEVRAYVKVASGISFDWWRTEFTGHDGSIYWRDIDVPMSWAESLGSGYSLQGKVGQKLYVNFTTGQVLVSTPDETPFPLENPVFRSSNTENSNDYDTFCRIENANTAVLTWKAVDGASGYRIKAGLQSKLSAGGAEVWENPDNVLLDQTVDANTTELRLPNLNYATPYRFAIQALSPRGEQYNSAWFGYGNGRNWYAYLGLQTNDRYDVPTVVSASGVTKTSMRVRLNRNIASYGLVQKEVFREHFNFVDADKNVLRVDYLTVQPSPDNPNAQMSPTYQHYVIPEWVWVNDVCELEIDGLSENSVYTIQAWDQTIEVPVDACYNTVLKRTKGTPDAPKLIQHVPTAVDTMQTLVGSEVIGDISQWNSMKLDKIINDYEAGNQAENQMFYLEGGKAYHISSNVQLYKGLTLATNPADLAQGKRAKLYLAGLLSAGTTSTQCNFMLGRQPLSSEEASVTLDIDSIRFLNLDVDVPLACNYGHSQEGLGGSTGNYFMNMYSNGLGFNLNLLEWSGCTFQGLIRGFYRVQGSNEYYLQHLHITDCDFYNDGFYQQNGGGFNYIHADHGSGAESNILTDVEISGCVFYDSPNGSLITDNNRNNYWDTSVRWNINVHHNTFVNFNTRANTPILNTRYVPGGSSLGFHDNVVILTRDAADEKRNMGSAGWDIRNIQGGAGSVTFNIYNNWTTNDPYLSDGQPFAANALNGMSNAPGKWYGWDIATYPYGRDELTVHLDETLTAIDLMTSPNPQHFIGSQPSHLDHHTDTGITGLHYQQTPKVLGSAIYKSGAGAARLR